MATGNHSAQRSRSAAAMSARARPTCPRRTPSRCIGPGLPQRIIPFFGHSLSQRLRPRPRRRPDCGGLRPYARHPPPRASQQHMTVVTRFAPSPTGYLHIGGARTALFNWLYARHVGGRFLLRIEDTDRQRSTQAAIDAIIDGLAWLGLEWDGDVVHQFARAERHAEVARQLLAEGKAYYCYSTPAELEAMREAQKAAGLPMRYDGRWRDRDPAEAPKDVPPVIRLKMPRSGETIVTDRVQGEVKVANEQLDDMVLLRADGTPVYMLSVV